MLVVVDCFCLIGMHALQVLGHLGFDFEDEQGMPLQQETGPDGKRSPTGKNTPGSRGNSQFLSWGGTSAMSFEVRWAGLVGRSRLM